MRSEACLKAERSIAIDGDGTITFSSGVSCIFVCSRMALPAGAEKREGISFYGISLRLYSADESSAKSNRMQISRSVLLFDI